MIIIPAIDIRGGRCVRLFQGRFDAETVYGDNPAAMAERWQAEGAVRLHVVDLDGAADGVPKNRDAIAAIINAARIPVQVGGGVRDVATIDEYVNLGVDRVVLGTRAALDPAFLREVCARFPGKVVVAIDARDGRVAIRGWLEATDRDALDVAREAAAAGAASLLYTDIRRDGTQEGPNLAALAAVSAATPTPVIASGGVSTPEHVRSLARIKGIEAAIVGQALYKGTLSLRDAMAASETRP
ncbi:MAG: 1-(5-phosphoribosyl)-5-[(5-phosphoribosylamino)methylideneamino]imidazole-4-carboxamide isomerase [Nitrospirota bacterium]